MRNMINSDKLSRIYRLIYLSYPYFLFLVYLFLFIEVYTYQGFTSKFFILGAREFSYVAIFLFFIIFLGKKIYNQNYDKTLQHKTFLFINSILTVPLFASYFILIAVEESTYLNYLFSIFYLILVNF